eukprot:1145423-Pelagomonas_calceolata.AAC.2
MVEDSAARKLQGLRLGEQPLRSNESLGHPTQGAKLTVGRNTNDFPPSGPEEASREVQQAVQEAMEQKAEEQAAEATMPAMGPFVPPTDSMSGRGDTGTPQVGHVPEGPATAAPTQGGAAAALREGKEKKNYAGGLLAVIPKKKVVLKIKLPLIYVEFMKIPDYLPPALLGAV